MKVDYGELRHFRDDPVCPGPVRKPSGPCFLFASVAALEAPVGSVAGEP